MNVLIIAPAYAPFGGVGSARMISLSEYLIKQEDQVTVLCNVPTCWPEDTLTQSVPSGVKVFHVNVVAESEMILGVSVNTRLYQEALDKLLQKGLPDICICSVGPYHIMKSIWKFREKYSLKYIIDYRDPWFTAWDRRAGILRNGKRLYIAARLYQKERRCVLNAAAIVSVVEPFRKYLGRLYPSSRSKIFCIRNGYDELALAKVDSADPCPGSISLTLTGKFAVYDPAAARTLFDAVAQVNEEGYGVKIVHIGSREEKAETLMNSTIGFSPEDFMPFGHHSYNECLSIIKGSRICLINYRDMNGLGTKVYDYIGANKPIIAFTPKGSEMEKLLNMFPRAYRCTSKEDAVKAIKEILDKGYTTLYDKDEGVAFTRGTSNKAYHSLLKEVCAKNGR